MKKTYALVSLLLLTLFVLGGCGSSNMSGGSGSNNSESSASADKPVVAIEIEDYGTITVELDPDTAPITVENFLNLVNEGFYDGLTFHRVINGFMIQGGDPNGNGSGGSETTIKGEFSKNGVANDMKHVRGTISMARSKANDSASSQFFIVHEEASHLDGSYAAFGQVIEGIEIVDEICANTPVQDGNGTVLTADQPTITSIKIVE